MELEYAALTDVGMKRPHNEDNFLVDEEIGLYVVCDGMGGHAKGEVASQMAVEAIRNFFIANKADPNITWPMDVMTGYSMEANILVAGIKDANFKIFQASRSDMRQRKMGTTVVSLVRTSKGIAVAHVGDSRCYRIRNGEITQITEDHSLLNDYKKKIQMTEEEIKNFQYKNIILRALGMKKEVEVDVQEFMPAKGDIYLLCSDGLSGEVDDSTMLQVVQDYSKDLQGGVKELIRLANEHGGKDNITVILVKVT